MKFKINEPRKIGNCEGTNSLEVSDKNLKNMSSEKIIKELKELAPNEEESKKMVNEYLSLDIKKKEEIKSYLKKEINPLISELTNNIDVEKMSLVEMREKMILLNSKIKELENKLKELSKEGKDNLLNKGAVKIRVKLSLLKIRKQNYC